MEQIDDIMHGTRRLIELIEEEHTEISKCIKGEILEVYQTLLKKEVEQLQEQLYTWNRFYY